MALNGSVTTSQVSCCAKVDRSLELDCFAIIMMKLQGLQEKGKKSWAHFLEAKHVNASAQITA